MSNELFTFENLTRKEIRHRIADIRPGDKGLELKLICLEKLKSMATREGGLLTTFRVADASGSMHCNFFGEFGQNLEEGHVIYATSFTANTYKDQLLLYQAKFSKAFILGKYFLEFSDGPNFSLTPSSKIN